MIDLRASKGVYRLPRLAGHWHPVDEKGRREMHRTGGPALTPLLTEDGRLEEQLILDPRGPAPGARPAVPEKVWLSRGGSARQWQAAVSAAGPGEALRGASRSAPPKAAAEAMTAALNYACAAEESGSPRTAGICYWPEDVLRREEMASRLAVDARRKAKTSQADGGRRAGGLGEDEDESRGKWRTADARAARGAECRGCQRREGPACRGRGPGTAGWSGPPADSAPEPRV